MFSQKAKECRNCKINVSVIEKFRTLLVTSSDIILITYKVSSMIIITMT